MTEKNQQWPPEIAQELGEFIMDFGDIDLLISVITAELITGNTDRLGDDFYQLLHPIPLGMRIRLLRDTYEEVAGVDALRKQTSLFKDLEKIVTKRNRISHDFWGAPYGLEDDPSEDIMHLFRMGSKRSRGEISIESTDLKALRKTASNVFFALDEFRNTFTTLFE